MTEQKRRGRPTKVPIDGERVSLGLRVTADLKRRLDETAAASGRSQSQEAERLLEQSFERQSILREVLALVYGNDDWAALLTKAQDVGKLRMKPSVKAAILRRMTERTTEMLDQIPDAPERTTAPQSPEQMLEIAKHLTQHLGGKVVKK